MLVNTYFKTPKTKRKKQKKRPPLFPLGYCYRCYWKYGIKRTIGLDRHHIYSGNPDRQHSEDNGLYVDLCNEFQPENCHWKVTNEKDREFIEHLKQEGQRRFETQYGQQEFMRIFQRNYL